MAEEPSLREYFERVAGENARLAIAHFGELRLAVNAIMTLDGFFGILHTRLHNIHARLARLRVGLDRLFRLVDHCSPAGN